MCLDAATGERVWHFQFVPTTAASETTTRRRFPCSWTCGMASLRIASIARAGAGEGKRGALLMPGQSPAAVMGS